MADFQSDPLGFLTRTAREFGDVVPLDLGDTVRYLINHPDLIAQVLVTTQGDFAKVEAGQPHNPPEIVMGHGLLQSEGDPWQRARRMVQPALHRDRLAFLSRFVTDATCSMTAHWQEESPTEVYSAALRLTQRILLAAVLGLESESDLAEAGSLFQEVADEYETRMTGLGQIGSAMPTAANLRLRRAVHRLDTAIYRTIAERRAAQHWGRDVLSTLLQTNAPQGEGPTDEQLRDELVTMVFAGRDSTAGAIAWSLQLLALHPDVQSRWQTELDRTVGNRLPEMADLPALPYTDMIVKEALRLYPPSWLLSRVARRPCRVGDLDLPEGATLLMSQWVVHRDPRYYPDPERFMPERWETDRVHSIPRYAYFPFGGGGRLCIGSNLATTVIILALATIGQRFQVLPTSASPAAPLPSLTLRPKGGIALLARRRAQWDAPGAAGQTKDWL